MIPNLPILDQTLFDSIERSEGTVERILECDCLFYFGEIRSGYFQRFRDTVERLRAESSGQSAIAICLQTPGGEVETVERFVNILRNHYDQVYFLVPDVAMSAGTIFCMSGDKIFMDYSSSLGPIDPQVPDREGRYLVPALGYLDKVEELIGKSEINQITPAEFALLEKQDLAMLRSYELARDLSIALLEKWLEKYKFKDWTKHRTTNPGAPVTDEERQARARETAQNLSDNKKWHSHGRAINIDTLRYELRLDIEDFGQDKDLRDAIRTYADTLTDWLGRHGVSFFLYNRRVM